MSKGIEIGSIVRFEDDNEGVVEGVLAYILDQGEATREGFMACLKVYSYSRCEIVASVPKKTDARAIVYHKDDKGYNVLSCLPLSLVSIVQSIEEKTDHAIGVVKSSDVLEVLVEDDPEGVSIVTFYLDRDQVRQVSR